MNVKPIIILYVILLGMVPGVLTRSTAQESVLKGPFNVSLEENTVAEQVAALEGITGHSIAYSSTVLPNPDQKMSLSATSLPLEQILRKVFNQVPVIFEVRGKRIMVLPDKEKISSKQIVSGHVRDKENGEVLIGATVRLEEAPRRGALTNAYGYFAIAAPSQEYHVIVQYIGYATQRIRIDLNKNIRLDINLSPVESSVDEVVVYANTPAEALSSPMAGTHTLDINQLKVMPAMAGEPDVIKMAQLLPGVKNVGEGSSGLYVRGGGIDQNLILLDEAPVYNPSHLLGFFSAFNADAIQHAELHKGSFPVKYGGRLSSVLDLRTKDGNKEKFSASGGIGLLASRLQVEGPIQKGKSSFLLSGRRTYPDLFFLFVDDDGGNKVNFYDLNGKLNFKLNENNHLYLAGYFGRDVFRFYDQYENQWGNATATLRWNHIFSPRFFANVSLIYSQYRYFIDNFIEGTTTFNWQSGVRDLNTKVDFTYYMGKAGKLEFGVNSIYHRFDPGSETDNRIPSIPKAKALESAVYLGHSWEPSKRFALSYGLRFTVYQRLGPDTTFTFDNQYRLQDSVIRDGGIYHTLTGWSPRLNMRYRFLKTARSKRDTTARFSFSRNSAIPSVLSTPFTSGCPAA